MPVEIKELVVRAVVEQDRETNRETARDQSQGPCTPEEREAIVEAAVAQVLRILRKAKER